MSGSRVSLLGKPARPNLEALQRAYGPWHQRMAGEALISFPRIGAGAQITVYPSIAVHQPLDYNIWLIASFGVAQRLVKI